MAHGTNIISAPVVMPTDIAAILGIDGTDLETLCTSPAINMWAVYKPIQVAQYNEITLAQRKSINFGIIKGLDTRIRNKQERYTATSLRALDILESLRPQMEEDIR